jgi:outer membrane protein assembly factor BamD (BamD/ComL family)
MKIGILKIWIAVLGISMLVLTSCQQKSVKNEAKDLRANLNRMEKELMQGNQTLDLVKGDSMVVMYKKFAVQYPNDTMAVEYLFRAAEIEMGMDKNQECIATLNDIQRMYPNSEKIPLLLQFKAFVYDDKFKAYNKARACLDELIEKYPDNVLVENAKAYRNMIGKDPNEMFQELDTTQTTN